MKKTAKKVATDEISVPVFRKQVRSLVRKWEKLLQTYEDTEERYGPSSARFKQVKKDLEKHEKLLDKISEIARGNLL